MPSDDDIIVSRRFERDDGEVLLFIHRPSPAPQPEVDADPGNPPWKCFYTIRFPDGEIQRRCSMGIDGMQALLLAIGAAGRGMRLMENGTPDMRPKIRWLGEDDLGLNIAHYE